MALCYENAAGRGQHRALADWLAQEIACGNLAPGERLPAERALGERVGVARGTVKKAYTLLEQRRLVRTALGSGTYVRVEQAPCATAGGELAAKAIQRLRELNLSRRQMEELMLSRIWESMPQAQRLCVAWVDCSEELLEPMAAALRHACGVQVQPYLVWQAVAEPALLFKPECAAVVTSIMHYEELMTVPALRTARFETAVLPLSHNTVCALARLPRGEGTRIAAVYATPQFREIIERYLEELGTTQPCDYFVLGTGKENGCKREGLLQSENALHHASDGGRSVETANAARAQGAGEPSAEQPSAEQENAEQPSAEQANAEQPNAAVLMQHLAQYAAVIVPPDEAYRAAELAPLRAACAAAGTALIPFTHEFDVGSLINLRGQLGRIWAQSALQGAE